MRNNLRILGRQRSRLPEQQLEHYSLIDDIEQQHQQDDKITSWTGQPWHKSKQTKIRQSLSEKKKSFNIRPHTIDVKRKAMVNWKRPSIVTFQSERNQTIVEKPKKLIINTIWDKNKLNTINVDIISRREDRPVSMIQYPLTINIKKKKNKYFGQIEKLISDLKL